MGSFFCAMTDSELTFVPYRQARHLVRDADLLLFRRRGLISIAGRGDHSHAAKAAWWGDDLFCLEVREWHGGRAVTLSSQVRRFPASIDVYQANPGERWPQYNRAGRHSADAQAGRLSLRLLGRRHGFATALARRAIGGAGRRMRRRAPGASAILQPGVRLCDRIGGGVDPVPHLADRMTLPADLARSPFYQYQFTLTA